METRQLKVAAEEIGKFRSMFTNLFALGDSIENVTALEERAARALRTLADAEARHKAILAVVNVEESAAAAEKRIADLTAAETKAAAAKEQAQTSLAVAKQDLGIVTAELATKQKMLSTIKAEIARIRGLAGA